MRIIGFPTFQAKIPKNLFRPKSPLSDERGCPEGAGELTTQVFYNSTNLQSYREQHD